MSFLLSGSEAGRDRDYGFGERLALPAVRIGQVGRRFEGITPLPGQSHGGNLTKGCQISFRGKKTVPVTPATRY